MFDLIELTTFKAKQQGKSLIDLQQQIKQIQLNHPCKEAVICRHDGTEGYVVEMHCKECGVPIHHDCFPIVALYNLSGDVWKTEFGGKVYQLNPKEHKEVI